MELKGQILLFTETGCKESMNTKTKLESLLLPYVEVDLTIYPEKRSEMESLCRKEDVPQIFFNECHIGSYSDLTKLESEDGLDALIELVKESEIPENAPKPPALYSLAAGHGNINKLGDILVKMGEQGKLVPHRKFLTVHHSSFTGHDLIEHLTESGNGSSPEDAIRIGQDMLDQGLIVHISGSKEFTVNNELFKVVGSDFPSALNAGLDLSGYDMSAVKIGEDLRKCMTSLAANHISDDGCRVDYDKIKTDVEFARYVVTAQALQRVCLKSLTRVERITLFVNVYNSLVVHGIISKGPPSNHLSRYKFFNNVSYIIAGHNYSLNDIENGVLRANRKGMTDFSCPFSPRDPRLVTALDEPEPRVHFALNCASKGCPPIRFYSADKLDSQLNKATKAFLSNGGCTVDKNTHQVSLSPILKWYKADFGKSDREMLKWVCGFINQTETGRLLEELIDTNQYKISWQKYDWTLNH